MLHEIFAPLLGTTLLSDGEKTAIYGLTLYPLVVYCFYEGIKNTNSVDPPGNGFIYSKERATAPHSGDNSYNYCAPGDGCAFLQLLQLISQNPNKRITHHTIPAATQITGVRIRIAKGAPGLSLPVNPKIR
ncbi:MAG: hypothetical protein HS126_39590 [Anaerolineales bacterium]|nr:hypothetical protein [Anaerolineales bacterium]